MAKKPFPTGTLVRHTSKFLRSIGSVTRRAIDGLVLGSGSLGNLVAWSDGTAAIVHHANLERTKKQLSSADAAVLVKAERAKAPSRMSDLYTATEAKGIVAKYNPKKAASARKSNPKRKKQLTREQAIAKLKRTKDLSTEMLKPLGIHFDTWLQWAQMPEARQKDMIKKLIAYYDTGEIKLKSGKVVKGPRKNLARRATPVRKANPKRRVAKKNPRRLSALTKI